VNPGCPPRKDAPCKWRLNEKDRLSMDFDRHDDTRFLVPLETSRGVEWAKAVHITRNSTIFLVRGAAPLWTCQV
jgi:hypothetical protein